MVLDTAQIMEGLRRNDPDTFRYLYRTYGGIVVGYVRKNSGTDQDAKEMVQTVFLEFWQTVRDGRYREEGKMDRFIYMLTANTWRDELRRRKVRRTQTLDTDNSTVADDSEMTLAEAIVKDKRLDAVHQCLNQLEAPCDDIIRLYHLEEVSLQDIAQNMNYDYNNLRKRIFDCRKKLKKLVDQYLQQH